MTADTPHATAIGSLTELSARLSQSPDAERLAPLAEETDQLIRSVQSFHMEAIRFRFYGLRRRLTQFDGQLPDGTLDLLERVRATLGEAGFPIK